jgi:signal transduction histidine kinase
VKWPFVSRRSYESLYSRYQLALDATAKARAERDSFRTAAQTSARQFVEADAANTRLAGRNRQLSERLAQRTESTPADVAQLRRRVDRLRRIVSRLLDERRQESRRADHLQQRLDDAMGLNTAPVLAGRRTGVRS